MIFPTVSFTFPKLSYVTTVNVSFLPITFGNPLFAGVTTSTAASFVFITVFCSVAPTLCATPSSSMADALMVLVIPATVALVDLNTTVATPVLFVSAVTGVPIATPSRVLNASPAVMLNVTVTPAGSAIPA